MTYPVPPSPWHCWVRILTGCTFQGHCRIPLLSIFRDRYIQRTASAGCVIVNKHMSPILQCDSVDPGVGIGKRRWLQGAPGLPLVAGNRLLDFTGTPAATEDLQASITVL